MSPVEFKKILCRPVEFKGQATQGPHYKRHDINAIFLKLICGIGPF